MDNGVVIKTHDVTKTFGNLKAVDGVSIQIRKRELHSLLGENGAGKTTLMKLVNGYHRLDGGEIEYFGERRSFKSPHEAVSSGIHTIFQDFSLIEQLTVEENFRLAFSYSKVAGDRSELMSKYGKGMNVQLKVSDLPLGLRQRVEIIKALSSGAKVLLLDEPTSVLAEDEKTELFQDLKKISEDVAVLISTHKLRDVTQFCDKVTVMRAGRVVLETDTKSTTVSDLARAMVGEKVESALGNIDVLYVSRSNLGSGTEAQAKGRAMLEVENLTVANDHGKIAVNGVTFAVHEREILGIIGVAGNGQTELTEALYGFRRPIGGIIKINGESLRSERGKKEVKFGYVPDDPVTVGLATNLSVGENLIFNDLEEFAKRGIILKDKALMFGRKCVEEFGIVTRGLDLPLGYLSGGNRQKVILARETLRSPKALIAVHPTRGLDFYTTNLVWKKLIELSNNGCAVLLVTEDIDEAFALSDRIGVTYEGRILGLHATETLDRVAVGHMMGGIKDRDAKHN